MTKGCSPVKRKTKNIRYITLADNIPEHWDSLIEVAKSSYTWYAYIFHDEDAEVSHRHLHLLLYDKGGTSLNSHCERFGGLIPVNMIEIVISPRAVARYLTHMDNPEKQQYSSSDIFSSSIDKYYDLIKSSSPDSVDLWHDFVKLRTGVYSPEDFIDKYRSELASMPMYQRFSMYTKIFDSCSYQLYHSASVSFDKRNVPPNLSIKEGSCLSPRDTEDSIIIKYKE